MVATPTTPDHLVSLSRRLLDEVSLICPRCDSPLTYDRSHIGGVAIVSGSRWDYYTCPACGAFQYRQRTANVVTLAQYLNGQTQKRLNGQSACGEWLR